jgi:hypothetical protein
MCHERWLACSTCGFLVEASGVELGGRVYCCQGCAVGGPCCCSYDLPETEGHDENSEPSPT